MFNYSQLRHHILRLAVTLLGIAIATPAIAQWTHRYPKLDDFRHQIYLEQHELPVLGHGPTDPAASPDGRWLAFAAQGWIWRLDLESGVATRLTNGAELDARPRWSPDSNRLVFVRDAGTDTSIVVLDIDRKREAVINTPTIDLDPEFSADGAYLFYTSGVGGSLSIWRRHLESGQDEQLTDLKQVERNARRLPDGRGFVYLHGDGPHRVLRLRDLRAGSDRIVHGETLTYHLSADVHPTLPVMTYAAPIDNAYHLWTMDLNDDRVTRRLTTGDPFAMTPAFSHDGKHIYFTSLGDDRQFTLQRMPAWGGSATSVDISRWDYGVDLGTLLVSTADKEGEPVTARVAIARDDGHPVAFSGDATYFDGQTGRHYFYVEGNATFSLPVGRYSIIATRGPMVPVVRDTVRVRSSANAAVDLTLMPLWEDASYASVDHHVHLNGDGHFRATHEDALRLAAGETLDHVTPMSWNRWERRIDESLVGRETARQERIVTQAQEVRSHFHGHIGLLNVSEPFEPWFFGPGNPVLGDPDLTNGDVTAHAVATGAFATYVHPLGGDGDPFDDLDAARMPLELVSDAVLAEALGLEIVCAWTSPLGNAELWYRLLNIGKPVAAMSGTDSWVDFHRTPAMGTGRTYVRLEGEELTSDSMLKAAAAGRSFVTTGPALTFTVGEGKRPGDVVEAGVQPWRAMLTSTMDVDVFEVIVNGVVVDTRDGVDAGERVELDGEVTLPAGGWVAVRAYASEQPADAWPTMHLRPFAHSSPVWIDTVGSVEASAQAAAAIDLLQAVSHAEQRARDGYGERAMPRLYARFEAARQALTGMRASE